MAKETKKRTMKPDLPYFEPDTRTDEEREAARLEARVQLAPVRKAGDLCRCGLKLIPVDWSMNGVENPPPICPKCRDLSAQCTCEGELF
jgi:hypothetical protein